jgi:murein DD-endopeptidase MepM/ murein hydrolase activator NlpD
MVQRMTKCPRLRLLSFNSLAFLSTSVTFTLLFSGCTPVTVSTSQTNSSQTITTTATLATPSATASPKESLQQTSPTPIAAAPSPAPSVEVAVVASVDPTKLLIPVVGIKPEQLTDTFKAARSEGRVHDAIDIPAAQGTPVIAVTDGRIAKLFYSERGGITIYQLDPDNKTIYYYAHLDRYADGLTENQQVKRGQVIGYVGNTGNAGPGNYHLHFSISIVTDPKRYWDGVNIDPYPILHGDVTKGQATAPQR